MLAVLENYLVNPSGEAGRWHERDLLQEHLNFWLKRVFNSRLLTFDSSFFREAVSLNIVELKDLSESLFVKLGLTPPHSRRSRSDLEADINYLGHAFLSENLHAYSPGRHQTFMATDASAQGAQKLLDGALESFVAQYTREEYFIPADM